MPRGRRLELSQSEMMRMREEEGLSNAQIAERLDISTVTVQKYIGKQPAEMTARNRRERIAKTVRESNIHRVRERKVPPETMMALRGAGKSNKEIAEELGITEWTVRYYIGKQPPEMLAANRRAAILKVHERKRAEKAAELMSEAEAALKMAQNEAETALKMAQEVEKAIEPEPEVVETPPEPVRPSAPVKASKTYQITTSIFQFAYFPHWYEHLHDLKEMARPEPWRFKSFELDPENYETPILSSYLHAVFIRLATLYNSSPAGEDERYIYIKGSTACFNTGLFTPLGKSLYAVFTQNERKGAQPWRFIGFAGDSSPHLRNVHPLPSHPLIADTSLDAFHPEWDIRVGIKHVLDNGANRKRLPESIRDAWNLPLLLTAAVELSKQKALESPDIVVRATGIQRHTGLYSPHYLLPLWITNPDTPDLVLCLLERDGYYTAPTGITTGMAYSNARNFGRPVAKWLTDLVE